MCSLINKQEKNLSFQSGCQCNLLLWQIFVCYSHDKISSNKINSLLYSSCLFGKILMCNVSYGVTGCVCDYGFEQAGHQSLENMTLPWNQV